jgi:MSHA biogenesis protein MshM
VNKKVFEMESLLEFFGLEQSPYSLTPNIELYYGLPRHEEALSLLDAALKKGDGFIKVTGEVGTGKTMVLRLFIANLTERYELVYIPNPVLTPGELKIAIARELDIDVENCTNLSLSDDINRKLLELNSQDKQVVLVIDEAQSLPNDTLEALRLLGNLETERQKMLHIVLFGQPELDEKLSMNIFRQLRQRITFSCYLSPLDFEQTYAYLNYRMRAAGYKGAELFGRRQAKKIYKYTKGIPRLINVVASKCLMLAYAQSLYKITNEHIKDSILDTKQNVVNVSNSVDKLTVFLIILIIIMLAAACILLIWE